MNKSLITIIAVAVLVLLGIGAYSLTRESREEGTMGEEMMEYNDAMQEETMMKDEDSAMQKDSDAMMNKDSGKTMMKDESSMMQTGSYEVYSPEKLVKADTGKVVLFFRAGWCPTCRALDADIRAHLKDIPGNLTILDVDYDKATDLKKKYGITYQHTLVQVDAKGNQITKWSGSPTLAALVSEVK